jgi:TP901 family phage tail tape measure protein
MYDIRSVGYEGANALDMLQTSSKLATAGLSTVEEAASGLTAAVKNFAAQNVTSEEAANAFMMTIEKGHTTMAQLNESFGQVAGTVASAGVSLNEFLGATASITNTGVNASVAMTGLGGALIAMQKPTAGMADALESLGFTGITAAQDIIRAKGGMIEAFRAIVKEGNKLGYTTNQIFGRREAAVQVQKTTGVLYDAQKEIVGALNEGGSVLDPAYAAKTATAAYQFKLLTNNIRELAIGIGEKLAPTMIFFSSILSGTVSVLRFLFTDLGFVSSALVNTLGVLTGLTAAFAAYEGIVWLSTKVQALWMAVMRSSIVVTAIERVQMIALAEGYLAAAGAVGIFVAGLAVATAGIYLAVAALSYLTDDYVDATSAANGFNDSLKKQNDLLRDQNGLLTPLGAKAKAFASMHNEWASSMQSEAVFGQKEQYWWNNGEYAKAIFQQLTHNPLGIFSSTGEEPQMSNFMTQDEINQLPKEYRNKYDNIHITTNFEAYDKTSGGVSIKNVNSYIMPTDSGTKPKI